MSVPVTILTGFLGSGKTTLLNRILREDHGRRIGVLVNDFGDVNIDAQLVQSMAGEPVDLSNGCICCSMRGGLVESTSRLLDRPNPPDYLIVEASGISDPVGVAGAFRTSALRDRVSIDSIICLADAEHVRDPRLDRQLIEVQLTAGDFVVLNKIDLVSPAHRDDLRTWITSLAPRARVLETSFASVALDLILGIRSDSLSVEPSLQHHHAHGHFSTITYRTTCPLSLRAVRAVLHDLPSSVFRAKGTVALADAPNLRFVAQVVGNRVHLEPISPWNGDTPETVLVFIGLGGHLDAAPLTDRLEAAHTAAVRLLPAENFRALRATASRPGTPALPRRS